MNNLKIGVRLVIGYVLVLALLLTVVIVGILRVGELQAEIDGLVKDKMEKLELANQMIIAVNDIGRNHRNALINQSEDDIKTELGNIAITRTAVAKALDTLEKDFTYGDKGKALLEAVVEYRGKYLAQSERLENFIKEFNFSDAIALFNSDYRPAYNDYIAKINDFIAYQTDLAGAVGAQAAAIASQTTTLLIVIGMSSLLIVILLAFVITRSITKPVNQVVEAARKMAKGDFNFTLKSEARDEIGEVVNAVEAIQIAVKRMIEDAAILAKAAVDGKLATRADASKHQGDFLVVVKGVNDTLDAVIGPLNVTAKYVDDISKGVIPPIITDNYNGDFNIIKNNLNAMVKMMSDLLKETDSIIRAAADGELDKRANADLFQGGWQKLVSGVNDTITNIVNPLMVTADYVDRISKGTIPAEIDTVYKGQYNIIKINLNQAIRAVNALVSDAGMLVQAAIDGKLATRADGDRHQGDYKKIVEGVNKTLDLVITPINEIIAVFKRMADGDLTANMTGIYKGDFDILKTALNSSLESINETLGQINTAVDQVAAGSVQVSQASQSLSQGATEQASSLEEITSSITEIASQTKQNTDNAIQVNGLAKTARNNAEAGNKQMQDLVAAMEDINKSAEEIKKIVKAIDDISFQINLLALNANVEAARAGKYGKGFAVVAEEVRNLAVRSANSVKETTRMVEETMGNIRRGNELVEVTAKQLSEIVTGAAQVANLAEEVSVASKEQSQGLEQISTGLNQIDQVTQSNTASAEESASASEELSSQSQQVKSMLARFKLTQRESKMSNADVMAMLRSEMARQTGSSKKPSVAAASKGVLGHAAHGVNPADVISLDDHNFGKF